MPMNQKQFDKFYKELNDKKKDECKICHLELLTSDTIESGICENCGDNY